MFSTFDEVLQHQINREATQAARECTPASMKPRHLRGKSEPRILVNGRWVRKDAEIVATRKLIFGPAQSSFDLRRAIVEWCAQIATETITQHLASRIALAQLLKKLTAEIKPPVEPGEEWKAGGE